MKVAFFISVRHHGRGGHVHSLNHIASALAKKVNVGIYSLGPKQSEVIQNNPSFKNHLFFNGKNFFDFKRNLEENLKNFKPDIIHCFDVSSYNILTFLHCTDKYLFVLNKCGGPNPVNFPFVQNLILFSKENERWFLSNKKFLKASVYVIPNRVNRAELEVGETQQLVAKQDAFCFLRIARIGSAYKKSIEDAIRLIEKIILNGIEGVHLYIIGTVEDEKVYNDIKHRVKELPISLLTKDKYTKKASNMLYLGDAVIATGRGIMEATALGLPILTPARNASIPILVNKVNFPLFLNTNFSERNTEIELDQAANLDNILKLITDKVYRNKMSEMSKGFFNEHFNVEGGVNAYLEVYQKALGIRGGYFFLSNLKHQLRTIYSFIRSSN